MGDFNMNLINILVHTDDKHTDNKDTGTFLETMFSQSFLLTLQHPLELQETQKH